jgi:lysozyme
VKINDAGRKIIMDAETCRLEAYKCPAGKWTIGYGHTGDVKPGMKLQSKHQAEVVLEYDLERFEDAVAALAPTANSNQFSALVSFAFNLGDANLRHSTLLARFNAGDVEGAAREFSRWIYATVEGRKVVLPGLVTRRTAEAALFLTAVT